MKKNYILWFLISFIPVLNFAQESKKWEGATNAEISNGFAGYARDYGYWSMGVAASYGITLNNHYFIGLGIKPNYIFSDGDFDGFFLPIYGEFKYRSIPNKKSFGGYCVARAGYSPISRKGAYIHMGGGIDYKKWEYGIGVTYQFCTFHEHSFNEITNHDYNLIFGTVSVGYNF